MALMRVRYKGLSDVRVISVDDAKEHGVHLSQDLVWDNQGQAYGAQLAGIKRPKFANNQKGILVEMSDELEQLLRREGTFTLTSVDSNTKEDKEEVVTGKALDDTGDTVVDTTTGQTSKKK